MWARSNEPGTNIAALWTTGKDRRLGDACSHKSAFDLQDRRNRGTALSALRLAASDAVRGSRNVSSLRELSNCRPAQPNGAVLSVACPGLWPLLPGTDPRIC